MKITHIDLAKSTSDSTLFVVQPSVRPNVYDVFLQLYRKRPDNPGCVVELDGGNLRVHSHNLPNGFTALLEQLLQDADGMVQYEHTMKEEKMKFEADMKQQELAALAKKMGVPLK